MYTFSYVAAVKKMQIYTQSAGSVSRLIQPQECVTQLKLKSTDTAVVKRQGTRSFLPSVIMTLIFPQGLWTSILIATQTFLSPACIIIIAILS